MESIATSPTRPLKRGRPRKTPFSPFSELRQKKFKTGPAEKRGRGRPKKPNRGRPPKAHSTTPSSETSFAEISSNDEETIARKRGRPPKARPEDPSTSEVSTMSESSLPSCSMDEKATLRNRFTPPSELILTPDSSDAKDRKKSGRPSRVKVSPLPDFSKMKSKKSAGRKSSVQTFEPVLQTSSQTPMTSMLDNVKPLNDFLIELELDNSGNNSTYRMSSESLRERLSNFSQRMARDSQLSYDSPMSSSTLPSPDSSSSPWNVSLTLPNGPFQFNGTPLKMMQPLEIPTFHLALDRSHSTSSDKQSNISSESLMGLPYLL